MRPSISIFKCASVHHMFYVSYEVQKIFWEKKFDAENVTDEVGDKLTKEVVNDKHDNSDKPTIGALLPGILKSTIGGINPTTCGKELHIVKTIRKY